jgi:hypothetical protein
MAVAAAVTAGRSAVASKAPRKIPFDNYKESPFVKIIVATENQAFYDGYVTALKDYSWMDVNGTVCVCYPKALPTTFSDARMKALKQLREKIG